MVRARELVLSWVHVWSARMSVRLQASVEHFSAEKVVTMLQQRNQVFERAFCADVGLVSEMASFANAW